MDFDEFRSEVVRVPLAFEGRELWVGYRPRMILEEDLEFLARLRSARIADIAVEAPPPPAGNRAAKRAAEKAARQANTATPAPTLIDHLKRLVVDWSFTRGGAPWPPSEEGFRLVEPLLRTAMVAAIVEHYLERPNLMSSSTPSSAGTASGPTTPISSSEPSSTGAASSPGTTSDAPNGAAARSGDSGSPTTRRR